MPADPNIYSAVRPVAVMSPADFEAQAAAREQAALVRQNAEEQTKQKIQAAREQSIAQSVLSRFGNDTEGALGELRRVAPGYAQNFETALNKHRKEAAEALKIENENAKVRHDQGMEMLRLAQATKNPDAYKRAVSLLAQDEEDLAAFPKEMPDDVLFGQMVDLGLSLDKVYEHRRDAIKDYQEGRPNQGFARSILAGDDDAADGALPMGVARSVVEKVKAMTPEQQREWATSVLKPEDSGAFTLSPGARRFNAKGELIAESPVSAGGQVGSFEDYVRRTYGESPTSQQILQARKSYGQADDRPPVTVRLDNGMTPNQAFNAERSLRAEFSRETKSAQTAMQQLALMKSSLKAVKDGKATAGSQGVLVTFQKILDPISVVRESEYARSASGLSLLSRLEGQWMKISQGGAGVTPKELEQFVSLAEQFANNQKAFAEQTRKQIDASATQYGLDPARITKDIGEPLGTLDAAPSATAPSGGGGIPSYQDYKNRKRK